MRIRLTEEIIFVKPSQVGGTEALLNMLGWAIQQDPSPTMCVYGPFRDRDVLWGLQGFEGRFLIGRYRVFAESGASTSCRHPASAAGKYIAVEEVTMDYERFFVTFKNFAMSLPARLTDEISGYIDPLEARRIEKELHQKIRNLLVAFVVAGVSKQDGGKK